MPENLILMQANNKGTDQPVHKCSLIYAIVIHSLDGRITCFRHIYTVSKKEGKD